MCRSSFFILHSTFSPFNAQICWSILLASALICAVVMCRSLFLEYFRFKISSRTSPVVYHGLGKEKSFRTQSSSFLTFFLHYFIPSSLYSHFFHSFIPSFFSFLSHPFFLFPSFHYFLIFFHFFTLSFSPFFL